MNNIFTFEMQDDQGFQEKQNTFNTQDFKSETKVKEDHQGLEEQINFKEFNQFNQLDLKQKKSVKNKSSLPFKQIQINKPDFNIENNLKKEKVQINDFKKNRSKYKKQNSGNMLSGLQVEDLGTKQMQYVSQKKALKVTDMRKFLHTPLGDYKVKAIIRKEGGNLFNFGTKFNVYIQQNNRYLFTISRQGLTQYNFSLQKNNFSEKKKSFLGKMFSNMTGTEFLLFDNGFSPKQTRQLQCCRKQLASIKYTTSSGPRKFTVIVSTNCQGFYCLQPEQNVLEQKWQKKQRDYLSILYSKTPQLDPEDGNYKLDFKGIVKKASVKNFILGGKQWDDSLIFGKISDETFIMQIKQPLGVLQAAAICVSSIHYKLHWK